MPDTDPSGGGSAHTTPDDGPRALPGPDGLRRSWIVWGLVLGFEALLLAGYFGLTGATVTQPRYVLYPFVWLNVGVWAVLRVGVPAAPRRRRLLVGAGAAVYFLALLWLAGLVGTTAHPESGGLGLRVALASPGWGPVVTYLGPVAHLTFVPYRVVGYIALSYLAYARALDAVGAALSGVLGFVSCVSCTFSVVASLGAGLAGGSTVAAGVYALSVDASTAVFLLAVGVLLWGPHLGRR